MIAEAAKHLHCLVLCLFLWRPWPFGEVAYDFANLVPHLVGLSAQFTSLFKSSSFVVVFARQCSSFIYLA
jgi:hypothetical protein